MIRSLPYGMSRGDVVTRALTDVENTPHDGHAAAVLLGSRHMHHTHPVS